MRRRVVCVVLAVLTTASGCTGDPSPKRRLDAARESVLVGEVDGGKALVAVVHDGSKYTVYTCGIGDSLKTHTGWFNGSVATGGSLATSVSAAGLKVAGSVSAREGSGTLVLKDGTSVTWHAERASRRGAGLFAHEDPVAFVGLIVTNDGRRAGNARVNQTDSNGNPAPPRSEPVESREGSGDDDPEGTFANGGGPQTVPMTPVRRPRAVTRDGKTLVFLAHGMSDTVGLSTSTRVEDCAAPTNTPAYGRCEWGQDFIAGVFGGTRAGIVSLNDENLADDNYIASVLNKPAREVEFDENLGHALDRRGCVTDPSKEDTYDSKTGKHFATVKVPPVQSPPPGAPAEVAPPLSVFTTWRDQTRGLVESGRRLLRQAYAALRYYEARYEETPGVVFVGQSFGGLATRFVLSNPPASTFDNQLLNPERTVICPEDRVKMDYLRDRTVYAVTLATPHEGSPLGAFGEPIKARLRELLNDLDRGVAATDVGKWINELKVYSGQQRPDPLGDLRTATRKWINEMLQLLDVPALRDLQPTTMERVNRGPLSPELARRTQGSVIVGGQGVAIPIYSTLARSPGSDVFDSPLIRAGAAELPRLRKKEQGWIMPGTMLSDYLMRKVFADGWGRADVAPYAGFQHILDRRRRIFDVAQSVTDATAEVQRLATAVVSQIAPYFAGAFGRATEGIVAFLRDKLIFPTLGGAVVPIHLDREWRIVMSGSVSVPMIGLTCDGTTAVFDYDPIVSALVRAHDRTQRALEALVNKDIVALLQAAGFTMQRNPQQFADTQRWMVDKISTMQEAPSKRCQLPSGKSMQDFFKLANVFNWKIKAVSGSVPAPAWEKTNTPARDGQMDTDGLVSSSSALGFTLARVPFFFEHNREDGPPGSDGRRTLGSWYRMPDGPGEAFNHGLQYRNVIGRWIRERFLEARVGPVPVRDGDSEWR